ncbi:5'-methylthioadenosine/adenosylhomocysteine nucleosidase [Mycobacterium riyadhense]
MDTISRVTIGIICALPQESSYLRGRLRDAERTKVAQIAFDTGELEARRVVVATAGMGKVNAGLVATLMVDRFRCSAIVFTGVAGGLDPQLRVGDIVIADRVVQHDFGLIENERLRPYQPGHLPFINRTERLGYEIEPELITRVKGRLDGLTLAPLSTDVNGRPPRIHYGTILTGDQYLHCEPTRIRLHNDFGGVAIDMESGALAQICESFGIPWLVIRGLSDGAGAESGPDFRRNVREVAARSARILPEVLPAVA